MLCCIDCGSDLELIRYKEVAGAIVHGIIGCKSCTRKYPIIEGVGVFFSEDDFSVYISNWETNYLMSRGYEEVLKAIPQTKQNEADSPQKAVADNWSYQWKSVYRWDTEDLERDHMFGEDFFWTFIPIDRNEVNDKVVFTACSGRGREAYHIRKHNPRKIIVNELGTEIYSIYELFDEADDTLLLIRCDISNHPLKPESVDITICDHALQHVGDHRVGFGKMVEATKPGGIVGICVYSHENNFIMNHLVEPSKKLLHLFPLPFIRALSVLPAVILFLFIHIIYKPISVLAPKIGKRIPLYDHMIFWSHNSFKILWLSCFDLMHAPISYHFKHDEIIQMADENNLKIRKLINTHGTTWSLIGEKDLKS